MGKNSITKAEVDALRSIQHKCYQQSFDSGWHSTPREFGTQLALAHSELSEALEGVRKNLMDSHLPHRPCGEVEFADCIIRLLDTAQVEGWDIAGALAEKMDYNASRADHKIENRLKVGGKAF